MNPHALVFWFALGLTGYFAARYFDLNPLDGFLTGVLLGIFLSSIAELRE